MAGIISPLNTTGRRIAWALMLLMLGGCATTPPRNTQNLCDIFAEYADWHQATRAAEQRWGTPIAIQMAFIRHESNFVEAARPQRVRLLGIIPWTRPSSAYGYAQAQDDTWTWYVEQTGHHGAQRDRFSDAVDFVAWHVAQAERVLGIPKWEVYRQYLAYHEGFRGYQQRSYQRQEWLQTYARKVAATANRYAAQLDQCPRG